MYFKINNRVLEANRDGGEGNGDSGTNNNQDNQVTFETWLQTLPEDTKKVAEPLYQAHVQRLQNAVRDTRTERDDLSKQLREASKKLKENSAERQELDDIASKLEMANKRADFYEEAPGEGCVNPKAAFVIAQSESLFDKKGLPDWTAIKEAAPQLFGDKTPRRAVTKRTAGNGNDGGRVPSGTSMNDWIRSAAGRSVTTE